MSQAELPPYLREQLARYDQIQQNLQSVLVQKQQVELEFNETEKALEELGKASDSEAIYKFAGNLLVRVQKEAMVKELNEKKELGSTRKMVLAKQESRFRESLKDLQTKIDDAVKGRQAQQSQPQPPGDA
ncbi:MAG: prefoldin subunit beta [Thaumarchaeota archaeon]|nr:prefoldin subunit beta [Nitrososphaerota archaeon]